MIPLSPAMVTTFAFLVGACIGSFLNVCIARWPAGLSVVSPPSRCPRCERPIRSYENVPIIGWLALRGRCAGCRERISVQYPLVELAIALMWGAAFYTYGFTFLSLRIAVFVTVLAGVAITDLKHYVIPDGFTLFGLIWTIVTAFVALFFSSELTLFATPYDALIGTFTGAGAVAVAGWIGEVALKREAMGFGDVTLMAVSGAALGPDRALLTIFIAAGIGVIVFLGIVYPVIWILEKTRGRPRELPLVPFGVFLAPASVVALFYGNALVHWYVSRFLGA
jgi:leader peptidase (prepilin peptidase)/N-methyltransferase